MSDADSLEHLVGQVLEKRYRILEPLGEGGMGAVFLGEHVVIGRQVAIKVLHARLGDSKDFSARFAREAVAAGRLDHPNCVPVTDSGLLEDGTAYLIMELVKGTSLGALLEEQGPGLDPIRSLRIVRHVLRGLGHAHGLGIVHRDIKPDNIMLTDREDDADFARILDFGIAKLRDDDNKGKEALTQAGMSVGTPSYLSPEQAMGDDVDHRSDLYSATVLLFEMLTGRPPFTAPNPVGILTKHASAPIPHIWDVAPHLSDYGELDELVRCGLAKIPDQRFASATDFVSAIDKTLVILGSQLTPLPVARESTREISAEFSGVNPLLVTGHQREITGPAYPHALANNSAATTTLPHTAQNRALTGPPLPPSNARRTQIRRATIAAAVVSVLLAGTLVLTGSSDKGSSPGADVQNQALLEKLKEERRQAAITKNLVILKEGKTCEERLSAVRKLETLNARRAIADLKRARRRMRGGVLGIGKKNTNKCLRKAAIKALKSLRGD